MSFKGSLKRRIILELKRIYVTAGMACKPSLALAAMSKAMEVWTEYVHTVLKSISEEVARSLAVQELKLALVFLSEASIDIIRLVAWIILLFMLAK